VAVYPDAQRLVTRDAEALLPQQPSDLLPRLLLLTSLGGRAMPQAANAGRKRLSIFLSMHPPSDEYKHTNHNNRYLCSTIGGVELECEAQMVNQKLFDVARRQH
jgi:hypothetical protein